VIFRDRPENLSLFVLYTGDLMPTYTFEDINTGERQEVFMKISELDDFRAQNPHLKTLILGAPALGDAHRLGLKKPDDGFRDVLKNVKHHHKKDNINTW